MRDFTEKPDQNTESPWMNDLLGQQSPSQTIFDHLPVAVGICALPPDSRILYLNAGFTKLFGYTITDIPTLEDWFVLAYRDPDYRSFCQHQWLKTLDEQTLETPSQAEFKISCKNGSVKTILVSITVFEDFILSSFVDITSLKKKEKELNKLQLDYSKILENAPIAIAIYHSSEADPSISFTNKLFQELFVYENSDITTVSQWFQRAYPDPEYRHQVMGQWQDLLVKQRQTGKPEYLQCRVINQQGDALEILFGAIDLGDQVIVAIQDLTAFKAVESELEKARKTLEKTALALTEAIPIGTYTMVKTPDRPLAYFSFMSERFLQLTGLKREEAESDPLKGFACVHPDDYEAWVALNAEVFAQKIPFYGETRVVVNGEVRWITAESVPRDLPDGSTVWEGVLADITDRKHYELALKEANDQISQINEELESRVKARTAALEEREARLEHINQELIKASRLKDEFLAMMSHELRTPLSAILGMAEILQEEIYGAINAQQQESLQTIERSGQHLLSLINDILDVAKIEAGKVDLQLQEVSVSHLCETSLTLVYAQAQKKQIQLKTSLPFHLPMLWVDESRLRQVLLNLLNNAVKFTPNQGQVTLEVIYPAVADQSPDHLRIAVKDTGIGIAAKDIGRLFQPFVQIDSALNRQYEGTGLGLALVKKIVDLHGGQVSVTSEVGVGSCFTVDLPVAPPPQPAAPASLGAVAQIPPDAPCPEAPLILLAEDNPTNVTTVKRYLEAKGCRLVIASDGAEAVHLAQSARPDLIIMDIQMPRLNGLEAIATIRANPALEATPILALTALVMESDRDQCLNVGANDYLSKPVRLRHLWETISRLYPSLG